MICGHSVDDILPVFTGFFNINVNNFINFMCITNLTKAKKVFFFVFFEENICDLGCEMVSIVPLCRTLFLHKRSLLATEVTYINILRKENLLNMQTE